MSRHKGYIYVSAADLEGCGPELRSGDRVSFEIYTDNQGIGACKVRPEAQPPPKPQEPQGRPRWWSELAGDCCPISLTPLEELEYEPFGLLGSPEEAGSGGLGGGAPAAGAEEEAWGGGGGEGLWGAPATAALLACKPVHWFDGKFLACSLVSKGQLWDPMSMRPLSRQECASLDAYLAAKGLPAVHVAEAFDLARAAAADAAAGEAPEELRRGRAERLAELGREASSLLCIFDDPQAWAMVPALPPPSAKAAPPPPPPATPGAVPRSPQGGASSPGPGPSPKAAPGAAAGRAAEAGPGARQRRWGREK